MQWLEFQMDPTNQDPTDLIDLRDRLVLMGALFEIGG